MVPSTSTATLLKLNTALSAAGAAALLLATSSVAEAQIYTWRDAKGTLVLSDRPLHPDAKTFSVPRAAGLRVTRNVARRSRAAAYDALIERHAVTHGVRPELVRAVIQVESGFNPRARSRKGALGLMQLMPRTAADLGVEDPLDPAENIRGGVSYLRQLLDLYAGDEELALAAYNAGPAAVARYGQQVPPYTETRDYVTRIRDGVTLVPGARGATVIYKTHETIDGRTVVKYSTTRPASGEYEVVAR
jgi:soluble lytic murein transglycosylase-like protein